MPSGIECVTRRKRIENGPATAASPGVTCRNTARSRTWCSSSWPSSSASVNAVPYTGSVDPSNSRSRYGSAPMWSWCPCVSTTASTSSNRSPTYSKSGSTRSMPGISACGKDRPTSTISRRPSSSTHAMLRPTSPTPPRKTTRAEAFGSEESGIHQRPADPLLLLGGRGHERQARRPDRVPDHPERGLDGDRIRRDEQRVEQRRELLVDLARGRDVARLDQIAHLADLPADQVACDRDDADRAEAHVAERGPVVPAVHLEVRRGLRDQLRDRLE